MVAEAPWRPWEQVWQGLGTEQLYEELLAPPPFICTLGSTGSDQLRAKQPALTPTLPGCQNSVHCLYPTPTLSSVLDGSLPNGLLKDKASLHIHL